MSQREIKPQLNADEREILERLHQNQESSIAVCANDFSFGYDRFIRAINTLMQLDSIDSTMFSPGPFERHQKFMFTFTGKVADSDTKVELIKTESGQKYLTAYPPWTSPVAPNE
jgi:hypothetical protein